MRIIEIYPKPVTTFPFLNAGKGAGQFFEDQLPVHHARVDRLPNGVSAIVVTSDLQGRERFQDAPDNAPRLLGEALPQQLLEQALLTLGVDNSVLASSMQTRHVTNGKRQRWNKPAPATLCLKPDYLKPA